MKVLSYKKHNCIGLSRLVYIPEEDKWISKVTTTRFKNLHEVFHEYEPDFYDGVIFPIYGCDECIDHLRVNVIDESPIKNISKKNVAGDPICIFVIEYYNKEYDYSKGEGLCAFAVYECEKQEIVTMK